MLINPNPISLSPNSYNLRKAPFPAILFTGRFSPSSSSERFTPMPNNNSFGFAAESVFCACDDVKGSELFFNSSQLPFEVWSVGFAGITSGFGLRACTSVNNRA